MRKREVSSSSRQRYVCIHSTTSTHYRTHTDLLSSFSLICSLGQYPDVDILAGDIASGGNITISALSANTDAGFVDIDADEGVDIDTNDVLADITLDAAGITLNTDDFTLDAADFVDIDARVVDIDAFGVTIDTDDFTLKGGSVDINTDDGDITLEAGGNNDVAVITNGGDFTVDGSTVLP